MERRLAEGPAHNDEIRAINERLMISAVQQHALAETATKTAESAIKSGTLYRMLAHNFPNGMVLLFDHDLVHLLADGRGLNTLGLSQETMEGKTLGETFTPQICRQLEPAYRAALAGETTVLEVRFPIALSPEETLEYIYQVQTLPVMDESGHIQAGMAVAQDVTVQRQAEGLIRWQAYHDVLTGLPNRALLRDRLDQVLAMSERTGHLAALLFLDLDRFKQVNDTLGHAVGDRLLEVVASRLTGSLRAEDTVARIGGDEFVVLLPSLQDTQDATKIAQILMDSLEGPISIDTHELHMTASIGISLFPLDGHTSDALMRTADAAMYKSKEDHHTQYAREIASAGGAATGFDAISV